MFWFALSPETIPAKLLRVAREGEMALSQLRAAHESWFPNYMSAGPMN